MADIGKMDRNLALEAVRVTEAAALAASLSETGAGGVPASLQTGVPFEPAASGGKYYALRIRGDSMIGVGIMNDDLVIIRQDVEARDGDIVIALLEDEATCKTLCLTPDGVWLRPENPAYPLIDGTGCQILGVVKAVYREY